MMLMPLILIMMSWLSSLLLLSLLTILMKSLSSWSLWCLRCLFAHRAVVAILPSLFRLDTWCSCLDSPFLSPFLFSLFFLSRCQCFPPLSPPCYTLLLLFLPLSPHCLYRSLLLARCSWNEPSDPEGPDGPNARFKKAMSLTGGELCRYVQGLAKSWWPGRAIVAESLARRKEDHPSGKVRWNP